MAKTDKSQEEAVGMLQEKMNPDPGQSAQFWLQIVELIGFAQLTLCFQPLRTIEKKMSTSATDPTTTAYVTFTIHINALFNSL